MPSQEKRLDFLPVRAGPQFCIIQAALNIGRGVEISMCLIATDSTAKRLLVGPVGPVWVVIPIRELKNNIEMREVGQRTEAFGILGKISESLTQHINQQIKRQEDAIMKVFFA